MSLLIMAQPIGTGQHLCTAEFRQQRHKVGIGSHMATPKGNRLHPPMGQLVGMGLQGFGINPPIADPERSRTAVGDQVQRWRRLTRRPLRVRQVRAREFVLRRA
mgnify:CR=1 FL=1